MVVDVVVVEKYPANKLDSVGGRDTVFGLDRIVLCFLASSL